MRSCTRRRPGFFGPVRSVVRCQVCRRLLVWGSRAWLGVLEVRPSHLIKIDSIDGI